MGMEGTTFRFEAGGPRSLLGFTGEGRQRVGTGRHPDPEDRSTRGSRERTEPAPTNAKRGGLDVLIEMRQHRITLHRRRQTQETQREMPVANRNGTTRQPIAGETVLEPSGKTVTSLIRQCHGEEEPFRPLTHRFCGALHRSGTLPHHAPVIASLASWSAAVVV